MTGQQKNESIRVIIIDDYTNIHKDFNTVFVQNSGPSELDYLENELFSKQLDQVATENDYLYELTFASRGQEGTELIQKATEEGMPYMLAFVDMRMPTGWDGLETIEHIWKIDPDIQIVICTACNDYNWNDVTTKLGRSENLVILKKPFEMSELLQLTRILIDKWKQSQKNLSSPSIHNKPNNQELDNSNSKERLSTFSASTEMLKEVNQKLRTPMNSLMGYTDLLDQSNLDQQQKDYINTIRDSGNSLLCIIDNVMDYYKIETGQLILDQTEFSLAAVARDICHMVKSQIDESSVELKCTLDPNIPDLFIGDPERLRQVLINLMSNAVKFTKAGQIELNIDVVREDQHEAVVKIKVNDSGAGIPEHKLKMIDEDLKRKESANHPKYEGIGLGLTISKNLVGLMFGHLEIESKDNHGSCFYFSIRLPKVATKSTDTTDLDYESQENEALQYWSKKNSESAANILVFEDNPTNQKLMKVLLTRLGHNVDIASNGQEGLKMFKQHSQYDIIFMDILLPGMEGFQVTQSIRQSGATEIPIIAITANVLEYSRADCLSAGMNDYLSKPISLQHIIDVIQKWVYSPKALQV